MVTDKLVNVKGKLVERLSQGELEENQYWQITYQLLLEEGIIEGPYIGANREVTVMVATKLLFKFPSKEYWGLENRYVALEGKELSENSREDLRKYSGLENSVRDHLRKEFGDDPVLRPRFENEISTYLMNETDLPALTSKQREAAVRIATVLEREFRIEELPKMIGNYDVSDLDSALNKL